jgi:hypothetical protein
VALLEGGQLEGRPERPGASTLAAARCSHPPKLRRPCPAPSLPWER